MTQRLKLSRAQLASFLKDAESIKQFENLFSVVDGVQAIGGGNTYDDIPVASMATIAAVLARVVTQLESITTAYPGADKAWSKKAILDVLTRLEALETEYPGGSRAWVTAQKYLTISGTAADSSKLEGKTWEAPAAIGSTTPAAATFTSATLTSLTASRALIADALKNIASSATTATELGYVSGVTSAIQTQLDGKLGLHATADAATTAGACTGNAATATKLAATKNIAGHAFDGSADITISASDVGALATGGTAAAATKLATARNIAGHSFDGTADISISASDVGALATAGTAADSSKLGGVAAASYAPLAAPAFTGNVSIEGYDNIRVIRKTAIADNTPTTIFSVTTTNEGGSGNGGTYAVFVKCLINHASSTGSSQTAAVAKEFTFSRAMVSGGTGTCSTVQDLTASAPTAATSSATRDIGTITATVSETSEFIVAFNLQIDLTGSSVSTADVITEVKVLYDSFTHAPTVS